MAYVERPVMKSGWLRPPSGAGGDSRLLLLGVLGLGAAVAGMAVLIDRGSYAVVTAVLIVIGLLLLSYPVFVRIGRGDGDHSLVALLMLALLAKLAFAIVRYWVVKEVYGSGDSTRYDEQGWDFAVAVRSGSIAPGVEALVGSEGTRNIVRLTGYMYAIIGRSIFGGFLLYSWLAFWGCLLVVRGVKRAFPEADQRRYLLLVMFWPSLLFWPSSIGKDAVMVFLLGVFAYGACLLLAPVVRARGLVFCAAAVLGILQIRSHVALVAALAFVVAYGFTVLFGGSRTQSRAGGAVRIVALLAVGALAVTAAGRTAEFFSDDSGDTADTGQALEETRRRTQQGGSEIDPVEVNSPVDVPLAVVSVLARPFPWEIRSAGMALAGAEALALLGLFALSWRRLLRWPPSARRRAILVYAVVYVVLFCVGFSSIGNAGILARQRSQMLPLLLLAAAVPTVRWWRGEGQGADEHLTDPRAGTTDVPPERETPLRPLR
jgi:hypothetical protein